MSWLQTLVVIVVAWFTVALGLLGVFNAIKWWVKRRSFRRYLVALQAEAEELTRDAASRAMPW